MTMTIADTAQRQGAPREGLLARHPLVFYFLLAFAFTWGYWWLIWAPLQLSAPLFQLGAFGPTAAAFLVLAITSGKPGVLRLLRSYVQWRVGVKWYLVMLLAVPALMLIAYLIMPGALADFRAPGPSFLLFYFSTFAWVLVLGGGPLGEEPGWRGFALPRLQQLYGPLVGTLIVGALWALWHLPIFFGSLSPKYVGPDATFISVCISFAEFLISVTGFSVLMTWVFNNSRGSVLMAILLHVSFDTSGVAYSQLVPTAPDFYVPVSFQTLGGAIVFGGAALVIIVATRGRLSYQRYQREVELPAVTGTAR
jgi:membrane protease YdiL (CAAX protease family)